MSIFGLYYETQDIGKTIKHSKRRFFWKFSIDGVEHQVELLASYFSGKRRVSINGINRFDGKRKGHFQFPFSISKVPCCIVEYGEMYDLQIAGKTFSAYNQFQPNTNGKKFIDLAGLIKDMKSTGWEEVKTAKTNATIVKLEGIDNDDVSNQKTKDQIKSETPRNNPQLEQPRQRATTSIPTLDKFSFDTFQSSTPRSNDLASSKNFGGMSARTPTSNVNDIFESFGFTSQKKDSPRPDWNPFADEQPKKFPTQEKVDLLNSNLLFEAPVTTSTTNSTQQVSAKIETGQATPSNQTTFGNLLDSNDSAIPTENKPIQQNFEQKMMSEFSNFGFDEPKTIPNQQAIDTNQINAFEGSWQSSTYQPQPYNELTATNFTSTPKNKSPEVVQQTENIVRENIWETELNNLSVPDQFVTNPTVQNNLQPVVENNIQNNTQTTLDQNLLDNNPFNHPIFTNADLTQLTQPQAEPTQNVEEHPEFIISDEKIENEAPQKKNDEPWDGVVIKEVEQVNPETTENVQQITENNNNNNNGVEQNPQTAWENKLQEIQNNEVQSQDRQSEQPLTTFTNDLL